MNQSSCTLNNYYIMVDRPEEGFVAPGVQTKGDVLLLAHPIH
jgi:hypothetical protein